MSKSIETLPVIENGHVPNVLLLGNGIARTFGGKSWEKIVTDRLKKYNSPYSYDDIKDVPATMQIVLATNDHVSEEMRSIAEDLRKHSVEGEEKDFVHKVLEIPADAVLTTNYDYDLEQAWGLKASNYYFQRCRRWTKAVKGKEKQFNLYQYSLVGSESDRKRIWHIHGDITYYKSMVMGHYYYGKLLSQIEHYVSDCVSRYKRAESTGKAFTPISWIDYFLTGNVYILGLEMYLAETDLWWLACCKKRNFPDTKIFFYKSDGSPHKNCQMMMQAYNFQHINLHFGKDEDRYKDYYLLAAKDISERMAK